MDYKEKETESLGINYVDVLADIAKDKGLLGLAEHILNYKESPISEEPVKPKYNITIMPEQHCDGCA